MIESSILGSGTMPGIWDSDPFQNYLSVEVPSRLGAEYDVRGTTLSGYSTPNDASSCSSDYDGFGLDDFDNYFPISDSFVSQILDNDAAGFLDLDCTDSPKKDSTVANFNPSSNVHQNAVEYLQSSKLWSHMLPDEQLNTLHALSDLVTYHMGIREQMEVIKIIEPTAIISPDVKEFALDVTNLNDEKLQKVKDFILKQKPHLQNSSKSLNSFSPLSSKKTSNTSSKVLSRKNDVSYTRTKRKSPKKEFNILFPAEDKKIMQKRQKQTRKERKSGFFVYEKKMVINRVLEDEDINILE